MPWLFHKKQSSDFQQLHQEVLDIKQVLEAIQGQISQLNTGPQEMERIKSELSKITEYFTIIDASDSNEALKHQLERLIVALTSPFYFAPSERVLEEAIHNAMELVYDFSRQKQEFYANGPHEIPLGTSSSYILPLDPVYHYQLLFSNPLQPETAATIMIIPRSYAFDEELKRLPNGVRRRAFDIHRRKAPPLLTDTLYMLQQKLWPTMYLVERKLLEDGRVKSLYWKCSETAYNGTLERFENYLCLYFDYFEEGTTVVTDTELPSQALPSPQGEKIPPSSDDDEKLSENNPVTQTGNSNEGDFQNYNDDTDIG